jgi:hypothetical protein
MLRGLEAREIPETVFLSSGKKRKSSAKSSFLSGKRSRKRNGRESSG